ncbi:hypothetical protein ACFW7K_06585 [Streptomyces sp. NPDC058735]|uniref:hypothetical protein n=1 Tax=unclassified Streptomyces TaxID=2593676 RepID=UPI0036CCFECE
MSEIQVHESAAAHAGDGAPRPAERGHTHDSLFKNAYFLMLSTGVSAALGPGFWLALWAYAVRHAEVSRLDDYGLVTALHPAFWAGLAVLTAGFRCTVRDPRRPGDWAAVHVLALLVMERATQAVVYPTPLYAWAWKHDEVVGRLQTAGQVGDMAVHDQWPGFYAAQTALVRLLGVESPTLFMAWWPLVSSLMLLLPLLLIYRTFTEDRRLVWTAFWLSTSPTGSGRTTSRPSRRPQRCPALPQRAALMGQEARRLPSVVHHRDPGPRPHQGAGSPPAPVRRTPPRPGPAASPDRRPR